MTVVRRVAVPVVCLLLVGGFRGSVFGTAAGLSRRSLIQATEDSAPGVLTYHNDWARTGQNLRETFLTPANVNPANFGLLKSDYAVDGAVLAQSLYMPGVVINGRRLNLVFVVTEHDTVYAFDADPDRHPQNWATPLWQRSLLDPGATPVPTGDQRDEEGGICDSIRPEIGITGTPVIDPATGTLYVVAKSKEADQTYAYTLYALDVTTGLDALAISAPVRITARDFVTPESSVPFNALRENQRAGLALVNGVVYVAFASYCDQTPYHGWLLGYDTTRALTQVVAFNTSSQDNFGGIWQSGGAPAIDKDASLFLAVGNGPYDPKAAQWGDAIVKLPADRPTVTAPAPLPVLDFFEPFNHSYLTSSDLDMGSGGILLLPDQAGPHPHVMVSGGKQGIVYVVDRDQMTAADAHQGRCTDAEWEQRFQPGAERTPLGEMQTCDPIVQAFEVAAGDSTDVTLARTYRGPGVFSTPSYWGGHVFLGAAGDTLKMYDVQEGQLTSEPVSMSPAPFAFPGAATSISANGDRNGIVWAVDSGDIRSTPAVLYAFDAGDLSRVLYKSTGTADDQLQSIAPSSDADTMTVGVKFSVPTVYGGKVFVATRTHLHVFGVKR